MMSTEFDPYNFSAFGGDLNNIELDSDIDNPLKNPARLRRGQKQPSQLLGKRRRSRVSSSVRIGTGNKGPTTNQSQLYQTLYEQNNINITTDYSYLNRSYPLYNHHPASIGDIEGNNNKITEQPLPTGNDSSFGVRSTNRSALKQLAATTASISSQNPYYQTQQRSLDRTYEYHQTRPSLKQQLQQPFSTMPHMSSGGGSGGGGGGGGHHHNQSSNSVSGSGQSTNSTNSGSNKPPMKAKRTRQRVDAGEPRNSYASIANFSSRGGYHGYNHNKYGSNSSSSGNNGSNNNSNHNSNQNQNNPNHYHHHHHHNHLMNNNNNNSGGGGGNLSSHHNSQQNPNNSNHYNYHHAQVNHHHQQQHSHHHHQHHHPQATMATAAFNNNANNVNLVPSTHHQPQHQLLQNSLNQDLQQQSFTNNGNHNTNVNKGSASSLLRDSTGSFPFGHHPSLPTATAGAASVPRSNDPIQSMMDSNLLQMCQNQMVAFMSGAYATNPAAAAAAATINAAAVTNSKQSPSSPPSSSSFKFPLEPNAEQFAAMQNSFYNPVSNNVFLNHLQQNTDPGLAITNLINNFQNETIVNNQFLNMAANSFDAQLLRDILESGGTSNSSTLGAGTGAGVGGGNVNNHRPDKAQLALQQAIANRLSYLTNNTNENTNEPKQSSSRSNATNKASSSSSSSTFATNKQRFDDLLDQWSVFDFDQQSLNSQSLQMVDKMDSCQLSIPGGEDHHNDDDGHRPIRPDEQDEDNNNNTGNNDGLVEEAERKNTNQRYYNNNSYRGQNSVAFQCADNNSNNNNSHKTITDENNMNGKNSKEINNEEGYVEQQQQQQQRPSNEEPDAATETTKKRPEEQNKEQHQQQHQQHQQQPQQITENGSGNVDIDKEVVNVPMEMRDGNLSKEERVDGGRGRPPTHSSVHSRSKSANMVSLLGSTSSSFSPTSSSSSSPTSSSTSSSTPTSTSSRTSSSTSSSSASATSTPSPKSGTISLDQQPTSTKQNGSTTTKAKLCSDSSTNRDLSPNNNRQSYQKTSSSSSTAINTIEQERAELISAGVVGCEQPSGITEIVREQENQDDEDESTTNMLLETSVQQATNNHSIENNIHPSPKSDCEDIEMMDAIKKHQFKQQQKQQLQQPKSISPSQRQQQQQQGVNGCKKRKLYQPQQTSKMLINSNGGSVIDTEEDDDEEEDDDDDVVDDGDEDLVEEEIEIPREVEDTASVEAELDEGYDESGEEQRQQSRQKIITTTTNNNNNNTNVDGVVVNNKELDLSTTTTNNNNITNSSNNNNNSRLPRNNHHRTSSSEPTAQRSPINQAKRARLSDYERDIGRIQQQLLQKYSQFYQQQQQQIHLHHHHQQPQQPQPQPLQQQNQSKSMINGGLYNSSNNINNRLASPINLAPIMANDCDTNLDIDLELKDNHPGSHHHQHQHQHQHQLKFRNQNHQENPDKFYKVHDVDLFIETVTDQIIQSIGKVIGNSIRQELELQNVNNNKSLQTSQQQQQPPEVPMPIHKSTDLLAQMLDGKYNRSMLKSTLSSTNNTAVMAAVSPRSPKITNTNNGSNNNSNHSKNLVGHETSSFLLPNETSESPASLKSTIHPQAALTPNSFLVANQPKTSSLFQNNPLAAVYNNARDNATTMLLNGLRDTSNSSISSSLVYGRDEPSPGLPEQTEAISLVVGTKKRRNKVTDTRLTPRTITRIPRGGDDGGRETCSVSPPVISNGGGPVLFPSTNPHGGVPVSLASLQQHANEYYDPINNSTSATTFPFAEQNPLGSFFGNPDLNVEMKNGLANINGMVNGSGGNAGSSDPVVSAVAQAAAAHHLKLLATSRASPDSLNGYGSALLTSYGHGSGTGSENGGDGSETNDTPSIYDPSMPMTSTLSPMHLRKAKLMFFYVRYPSSSILKMFFPDIKFNKNNTAQLVKWFSNFREFYYIQMEKYARQALNDGVKGADDLNVTDDCELLRVLNLHYNRSNHIPIPENFRTVSETTLREFFKSLQQNKDTEQSWKKAIYKVIARLDDSVPEYFKNPNFMEQLE